MEISKILQFLVPKDRKFFPLFEQAADNLVKSAILLNKMLMISNQEEREIAISDIKAHEKKGDNITHQIFEELNKTFITPFDREDIQGLTSSMDDVLDYINSSAQKIKLYKPNQICTEFIDMSDLIVQAAREIKTAIDCLHDLKDISTIKNSCIRINDIENQADEIYYHTISSLFRNETDAIELIKIKEIIQTLEKATDKAEDVADVLKTIVVKLA